MRSDSDQGANHDLHTGKEINNKRCKDGRLIDDLKKKMKLVQKTLQLIRITRILSKGNNEAVTTNLSEGSVLRSYIQLYIWTPLLQHQVYSILFFFLN